MALSAVHRLGGRFGRGRLIDHLLGKTKEVSGQEAAMSTFGVGQELSAAEWRDLIEQLLFEGLLREDPNDGRPLIGLGEAEGVRAVYRGERQVMTRADSPAPARQKRGRRSREAAAEMSGADQPLFEALRSWRGRAAKAQGVPPYVIFHDRTLAEIAALRPASRAALERISGVGESKLARYGEAVLEVVRGFME
jgi:ATP-dependent DNA helicase RecQ